VSFVALYQAGYKVSEMFGMFSGQMQDALTPAAARLNIQRDMGGLRDLLLRSTQLTLLLTVPLYGLSAAYLDPLIRTLTGLKEVDSATFWVGQSLLFATFSSLVTNSCSKRILMMCGWEKKLLVLSLVDAFANLVLSLVLVRPLGVLGVAIGTMIPTVLIGWLWVVPLTARFSELSLGRFIRETFGPVATPLFAGAAMLGALLWLAPMPIGGNFVDCAWRGLLVVITVGALGWRQARSLRASP
jgi:O-antigen/teichoic acid export membrane protein